MYAILDIETTGGKYNEEGITEIAIYRFDGHNIVDQFSSLVNPEKPIQPFVVNLTGINNDMLRQAPKFYEVAKRIIEITEGCVMVAHNALFDNRILTTEFDRLGYFFEKETLCTVELAKRLIPDMPSYSLGKLVRSLGIPLSDRHRAQGDAKATVALFKMLLAKDSSKLIISETLRKDHKKNLEPNLLEMVGNLPSETGVYYMRDKAGKITYIGKSRNIKKRVTQHFTGENRRSKKMQLEVTSVTFERTGNELIAILKEHEEIKLNKPLYNRSLRRAIFTHQLTSYVNDNGYIILKIEPADGRKKTIVTFSNYQQARSWLARITAENDLCHQLNSINTTSSNAESFNCGVCTKTESVENYNDRVREVLEKNSLYKQSFLIIDRGRDLSERSVILMEDGKFMGYGFYDLNYQITKPEVLKSIITPLPDNRQVQHLIQNYLRKNKVLKTVTLDSNNPLT